ncbi:hypothetical protein CAL7716_091150 [Calothrix sp. PCC 7716]|nr:hypothetical protein CAL7716_091150 [Calothrix sp. PCC 7716]
MTSRSIEIQTLIADIDNLLANNKGKRLVRVLANQGQEPRQVLERVRDFLASIETEPQSSQAALLSPLLAKYIGSDDLPNNESQSQQLNSPSSQINDLRTLIEPLRVEIQTMQQERKNLVEEIRQLEQQRMHNYSLANQMANQEQMIAEFLQVLANRVSTTAPQLPAPVQPLSTPEQMYDRLATAPPLLKSEAPSVIEAQSAELLERISRSYNELDQKIVEFDGNVNLSFETLQRDLNNYRSSLTEALVSMQNEGVQGEQLLKNWIDNLMQQLQSVNMFLSELANKSQSLQHQTQQEAQNTVSLPDIDTTLVDDANVTPDLDALLLELNPNVNSFSANSNIQSLQITKTNTQSTVDEVDLLYASLFGASDTPTSYQQVSLPLSNPISVIPSPVNLEAPLTPTEPEVTPDTVDIFDTVDVAANLDSLTSPPSQDEKIISSISIESALQPPTSEETIHITSTTFITPSVPAELPETVETVEIVETSSAPETETTFVPDPWLDSADAGLLDLQDFQAPQETSIARQTSNAWETFVRIDQASTHYELTAADTITSLTDLVFEDASTLIGIDIPENHINQTNNVITTLPKEALLSEASAQVDAAMPNILLDEEQIQRLDQDLKKFDGEQYINPSPQQNEEKPEEKPEEKLATTSIDNYEDIPDTVDSAWYLGIDLGTTGISAALLNRLTAEVYPLYWSTDDINTNGAKRSFRLPAEVYLPASAGLPIGSQDSTQSTQNLFSAELKPYLQIALPYRSEKQIQSNEDQDLPLDQSAAKTSHRWEPVLQLNEVATVPLVWMVRSLSKLLLTLKSDRNSTTLGLTATAMGINQESFRRIIDNISGVVCSCPSNWSEQYRFNIREALLLSKLIVHPQQVFFVEEAVASLLSELDGANGEEVKLNTRNGFRSAKSSEQSLQGNTLIMNIGASATEMGLVELPENLLELSHNDFMLHSFAYGGKGIEIDILCQLLLPPKWRQPVSEKPSSEPIASNPLHWQPNIQGLEATRLSSLKWEELTLPRPGEPDIMERIRLLQRLESSRLGQALLDAATAMKLILQHQESFSFELADQRWVLQRRDLEGQVFVPFVRRLNRELNRLLVARGIPTEAINQAILTGGVATLGAVSRWLRQKLPNARIIQDLYLGENGAPTCSRVAYGLSLLPLHPQVLEVSRQQYTDYFLFTELLRVLPEHALTFGEVIALFEERGINTRNCQQRLLAFLEGELPAGLVPGNTESMWLTQASLENFDYKATKEAELFEKQGSLTYRPNIQQINTLRRLLDAVKASTQQSLEEPYTVNFAVGVPL